MQTRSICDFLLFSILIISLTSCYSESKIKTRVYNPEVTETVSDSCEVVLVNSTNKEFYSGIGAVEARLNNQNLGKILIGDSMTITAPRGQNKLFIEHLDVMYFSTDHDLKLENKVTFIIIKTRPLWHQIKIMDPLSEKFIRLNEKKKEKIIKEKKKLADRKAKRDKKDDAKYLKQKNSNNKEKRTKKNTSEKQKKEKKVKEPKEKKSKIDKVDGEKSKEKKVKPKEKKPKNESTKKDNKGKKQKKEKKEKKPKEKTSKEKKPKNKKKDKKNT